MDLIWFFRLVKDFGSWDDFGNMQDLVITYFSGKFCMTCDRLRDNFGS